MIMIPYHFLVSLPFFHVKESKLDLKAKRLLLMKLSIGVKRYHLWCPYLKREKIDLSKDITFDESSLLKHDKKIVLKKRRLL